MWSTAPLPVTLVEHFAVIMGNLLWALGWKHRPGLNKVFLGVIEWRIRRLKGQIETLLARAEAGTLRTRSPADPDKPRKPRVPRPVSEKPAPNLHPSAKDWPLPRKFGWLIPLVPAWAAGSAGHLAIQLKDPKLAALVFAHPVLAARFRPLCWMLGVDRDLLPPLPPARRRMLPPECPSGAAPGSPQTNCETPLETLAAQSGQVDREARSDDREFLNSRSQLSGGGERGDPSFMASPVSEV